MERPFQILRSTIASRQEFTVRDGYQETHAIFYLKEGSFRIEIDGVVEKIQAGDCVILPNDVRFRRNVVSPIVFVYIKFARTPGIEAVPLPHGKIRFRDRARFLSTIAAMEKLMDREDDLSVAYQEHLLCDILLQAWHEGAAEEKDSYRDAMVDAAAAFIAGNLEKKLRLDDLCRELGTNSSTLNYRFRRATGLSVGRFIQLEQMKRARQLLSGTTYSMAQIAARCGFENAYYFSTAFKKIHGMAPSAYRK